MSLSRIVSIARKDITGSTWSVLIVFAVIIPIVMTLLINLVFGSFFLGKPTLAVIDEGESALGQRIAELDSVLIRTKNRCAHESRAVQSTPG